MGLRAGPLTPPTLLDSTGRPEAASITMPGMVLTAVIASAPASTTARAMRAMSGTLGASLTLMAMRSFVVRTEVRTEGAKAPTTNLSRACRTDAVTAAALSAVPANGVPNSSPTLGQEMLTSIRSGWA